MKKTDQFIFDQLALEHVGAPPLLNEEAIKLWGQIHQNVLEHYISYLANYVTPKSIGPVEKHPYITLHQNDFSHNRRFLLLGTFPPSTYFNNLNLPGLPNANIGGNIPLHFYYGNMSMLWQHLFSLDINQIPSEDRIHILQTNLENQNISISDVFEFVQRTNMISPSDSSYRNIILNQQIAEIFTHDSKIDTVLFTSGSLRTFLKNTTSALTGFKWIIDKCLPQLELQVSGTANGNGPYYPFSPPTYNQQSLSAAVAQQNGGIIWWLKTKEKRIRIINLPSPSLSANINMYGSSFFHKWVNYEAMIGDIPAPNANQVNNLKHGYLPLYPHIFPEPVLTNYKTEVYQMVLANTIANI